MEAYQFKPRRQILLPHIIVEKAEAQSGKVIYDPIVPEKWSPSRNPTKI